MSSNIGAVFHGVNDIRIESRPDAAPTGPKEVKLQGLYCGLCGSDQHLFHEGELGDFRFSVPYVLGHEATARVLEIGSEVKHLKVGDIVTMEPAIPCDSCRLCRSGHYNWCDTCNHQAKGMPGTDESKCSGFLQKYFTHPADFCYKIPDSVDPKVGALCEPLAVCVHAAERAKLTVNQKILVTGAGTMGLLCMLIAKAYGATSVVVADIKQSRLDVAKKLGADFTVLLDKTADPFVTGKRMKDECGGAVDVALECTGAESCSIIAVESCGMGGKVVAVGLGPRLIKFPLATASLKELDIIGVCRFDAGSFEQAVVFVEKFKDVLPLILTHVFPLNKVVNALHVMQSGEGVKFLIDLENAKI